MLRTEAVAVMSNVRLESISGNDPELRVALSRASLPTDDINDEGKAFFALRDLAGKAVAFSGLETCAEDRLLRSVVVVPGEQAKGHGRVAVELTLSTVPPDANVFLVTTTAASYFAKHGFMAISRSELPDALLATRQLSGLCSASATVMKLTRPRKHTMTDKTYNVLFLCTGNSARSILAEPILNRESNGRFRAFFAGSHPKGEVHPWR